MLFLEAESTKPITCLAFSPDGMRLLVGGSGPVQIWDAFGGVIGTCDDIADTKRCHSLAWSPSGLGCVFSHDRLIWKWNGEYTRGLAFPQISRDSIDTYHLEYLTEDLLAVGQGHSNEVGNGAFRLHYMTDGKKDPAPHLESTGVRAVAVHRPSKHVAWTTGQSMLKLWKTDRPDVKSIPLKKTAAKVAFAPDGESLAVIQDWAVMSFDVRTKHPKQTYTGHKGKVTSLAYSTDGRTLVTGSWDETVRIWDVATAKEIQAFAWKIGQITALSYAPDGTRIAAASSSGKVIIWDVD